MFACFVAFIVYVCTLQWALGTCAPQNRTMRPALVWLQVVPLLGTIWQFFVVRALGVSLANERASRAVPHDRDSGEHLGWTKAIVDAVALAFAIGSLISGWAYAGCPEGTPNVAGYVYGSLVAATWSSLLLSFGLSIAYWMAVHKSAWRLRSLGLRQPTIGAPAEPVRFCTHCGGFTASDSFCRRCGARQEPSGVTETA